MGSRTLIGIPGDIACRPFRDALHSAGGFEIVLDAPASLAQRLEHRGLNGALLSPIDYARNASEYLIVPGAAVSSQTGNESIVIHFRQGVRAVKTLAVQPVSASDIILAKILLAERFDIEPRIMPLAGNLEAMLARADAALLAGDAALGSVRERPEALDLVEEWIAATDLPYVHGFWCAREKMLTEPERTLLGGLGTGPDGPAPGAEGPSPFDLFSYDFPDNVQEGIREFLRYAYYHGILPDVPDLRFFGSDDADEPGSPLLSPN
jgi:chorismate dehydratase